MAIYGFLVRGGTCLHRAGQGAAVNFAYVWLVSRWIYLEGSVSFLSYNTVARGLKSL